MLWNILTQVFSTLTQNRLRSILTMFGIAWGILSVILMTAMGEGFRAAQKQNAQNLGKDIMIIRGGQTSIQAQGLQAGRRIRLTYSDFETIQTQAHLIRYASPEITRDDLVATTPINNGTFGVHGVFPEYHYMRTVEIAWGREINRADNEQRRAVCILGSQVNDQLFNGRNSVGENVRLDGIPSPSLG